MNQDSAAFIRAIRGPVMMITVGALFALDNFTPFGFGQTWPVLLIVVGILSLGGKPARWETRGSYRAEWGPPRRSRSSEAAPPPPPPPPPPSTAETAQPGSYRGSAYEANPSKPASPDDPGGHNETLG